MVALGSIRDRPIEEMPSAKTTSSARSRRPLTNLTSTPLSSWSKPAANSPSTYRSRPKSSSRAR